MTVLSAEDFKRATAIAVKAIGHRAELEVGFGGATAEAGETRVCLPDTPPKMTQDDLDYTRGSADAAALRLRYHNARLHKTKAPSDTEACAFFDALEQARCEALGARSLKGVASNLSALLDEDSRRALLQNQPPLAQALHVLAWESFTHSALPADAARIAVIGRPLLVHRAQEHWQKLSSLLADQKAFAAEALRLIKSLDQDTENNEKPDDAKTDQAAPATPDEKEEEQPDDSKESQGVSDSETDEEEGKDGGDLGEDNPDETPSDSAAPAENDSAHDDSPHSTVTTYRAFTTQFDEIVAASDLCHADELTRLRAMLDRQVGAMQQLVVKLANRLQRRLMAQQARQWEFDLEEGLLDAARLARVVVSPAYALSYKREKPMDFRDTIVTLLLDNSGSMRGRPITLAAQSADILARTLERCGVKAEILGFTTRAWKGGSSRDAWVKAGKPPLPGRLNDLRHIVYKSADQPWRHARKNLGLMLREGLLKENIDGEALLWAAQRLLARPEQRKILMVISDGAPVDDSTLSVNPGNYLEQHLRSVIAWIEDRTDIELTAIGIGHDVTRTYRRAVTIADTEQLAPVMTEQLGALFERD
ncbi:MAG: cobaltochelatase subunit CobT [Alphaproteobacteria bacterium]|nr:cobaltochelatase subunit CobT [Alphaproteobacteria bacterium]